MDIKPDVLLHYSPKIGVFGDPIPFFWDGKYHLYYQNSPGKFSFDKMNWAHIASKDLLNWELLSVALTPEPDSPDAFGCWTGSVLHWKNTFHIFYTGCAKPDGGLQTICHATSSDLIHWQKDKRNPIITPFPPFSTETKSAWRDPCVIQDETGFRMLITAEMAKKPRALCGCIIEFHSTDLEIWEFKRILYSPLVTSKMECPDLFKLDNRWLMLYSNDGVEVRWSENGHEHWKKTEPFHLDNFRFYAGKTLLDDKNRRLFFGFISDRENKNDFSPWKWGGILPFPRQLSFGKDNELIVSAIDEIKLLRKNQLPIKVSESIYTIGKWQVQGSNLYGVATEDQEGITTLLGQHPDSWEISMQLNLEAASNASLIFNCQEDYSSGYRLEINTEQSEFTLNNLSSSIVGESLLLQAFKLPRHIGKKVEIRVIFDNTSLEIYLNNAFCFSSRIYPQSLNANWWGFYSTCDSLLVEKIETWQLTL